MTRLAAAIRDKVDYAEGLESSRETDCGDRDVEVDSVRNIALLNTPIEAIQHMTVKEIVSVQRILQHGDTVGLWCTPKHWLVPSLRTGKSFTQLDLRKRILAYLPKDVKLERSSNTPQIELVDAAVLTLTRYLLLLRLAPTLTRGFTTSERSLDVSTIATKAYTQLSLLMSRALANYLKKSKFEQEIDFPSAPEKHDPRLLSRLDRLDLSEFSHFTRRGVYFECHRMRMLHESKLWWDVPSIELPSKSKVLVGPALFNAKDPTKNEFKPLPDDYISTMGQRSIWIIQELAPNILSIASKMLGLWKSTDNAKVTRETVAENRRVGIKKIISKHKWIDSSGNILEKPPFRINLAGNKRVFGRQSHNSMEIERKGSAWLPQGYPDIRSLFGTIQIAHFFIVSLSTGARQSETLELKRTCITYLADGQANICGKIFKLERRFEGEMREWILPSVAADAIEQQIRLIQIAEQLYTIYPTPLIAKEASTPKNHLWAQLAMAGESDARQPLCNINQALIRYATTLEMSTHPGEQRFSSHRFRKSLARLVGLALTQAPKILMELFGHKSIEMTLHYILSDKILRKEIEVITRELRIMRAKEVVERMVEADVNISKNQSDKLGGYGGLGAISTWSAVTSFRDKVFRRGEQWEIQSVVDLSELLTLQGTAWEQVRHGIICTKFPGQAGPCNKSAGRPEPSKCNSNCNYRLEEAFLREDVDDSIRAALEAYKRDSSNAESLSAAFWAGQIRTNITRFSDLNEKWMKDPAVQSLLQQSQGSSQQ